jgi:hypothetical protein
LLSTVLAGSLSKLPASTWLAAAPIYIASPDL